MNLKSLNRRKFLIILSICLGLFVSVMNIKNQLLISNYDWDIDNELYFGQELRRGNLVWTSEFNDKLPLLQLLFLLPGATKSVLVWKLISLGFCLTAIMIIVILFPKILKSEGWTNTQSKLIALYSILLFLFLITFLPGDFTHINASASSAAIIFSISFYYTLNLDPKIKKSIFLLLVAVISFTVSISIRPYFIYPLSLTVTIVSLRYLKVIGVKPLYKRLGISSAILVMLVLILFLSNAAPYLATGQFGTFVDGIRLLNSYNIPLSIMLQLQSDFMASKSKQLIFILSILFSLFFIFKNISSIKKSVSIIFILSLSYFSLILGISQHHWWPHYATLFSWYISLIIVYGCTYFLKLFNTRFQLKNLGKNILFTLLLLTLILITKLCYDFSHSKNSLTKLPHHQELQSLIVDDYIRKNFLVRPSFLAPHNAYIHWKLNESRHGFPTPAHTMHIEWGWWENFPTSNNFFTPKNYVQYCQEIVNSRIELILIEPNSPIFGCLEKQKVFMLGKIMQGESLVSHYFYRQS